MNPRRGENWLRGVSYAWEQVQSSLAGADRVADLLAEPPEVHDTSSAAALEGRARGALAFREVAFEYTPGIPVLEGFRSGSLNQLVQIHAR